MSGLATRRRLTALSVALVWGWGAQAQGVPPGCTAEGNAGGAAAGALIGGVAGALLGNAVAGRHKAGGTIVGGVTGAAAGAMIGGSQPCPQGYVYRAAPAPVEGPGPLVVREDDFWYGAPPDIHERIAFLRRRLEKLDGDGWLNPREFEGLRRRLVEVAGTEERARDENGGRIPPVTRARLNDDLNEVARHLRWKEYRARHAAE